MGKYWFKHDHGARNDPKLQMVLQELGHEGKSVFWDLIEMLYEQGGKLPLSESKSYAFTLRTSMQVVQSLINDFDLFQNDGISFWNARASSRIEEFSEKSEKATRSIEARWKRKGQQPSGIRTYNERNTNVSQNDTTVIQEYRIENIDKENNNPLPPKGGESVSSGSFTSGYEDFEVFWNTYGKKVDRSKCERKFKNLSKADREAIYRHVPGYVASTPKVQYRKNPLSYLNGKCWLDEGLPGNDTLAVNTEQFRIIKALRVNERFKLIEFEDDWPPYQVTSSEIQAINRSDKQLSDYDRKIKL